MSPSPTTWQVILPVKRLSEAKSRLAAPKGARAELVLAMARDTLAAVESCDDVSRTWLLTADPSVVDALATAELGVLHETPHPSTNALNAAVTRAISELRARDGSTNVAIVVADLPALHPDELAAALTHAAEHEASFVADADDIGTTAVMLGSHSTLMPTFGLQSGERHHAAKMVSVDAGPGLRRDVDTLIALAAAQEIGVGPHTSAVIDRRLR